MTILLAVFPIIFYKYYSVGVQSMITTFNFSLTVDLNKSGGSVEGLQEHPTDPGKV